MRKFFVVLILYCFAQAVFSQTSSIKGAIRDTSDKKNLPHAVISIFNNSDSVLVKFTRTDSTGSFNVTNLEPGEYRMLVTYPKLPIIRIGSLYLQTSNWI